MWEAIDYTGLAHAHRVTKHLCNGPGMLTNVHPASLEGSYILFLEAKGHALCGVMQFA